MKRPAPDSQTVAYLADREGPWRRATDERKLSTKNVRFVGLDTAAMVEAGGEVRSPGAIPNRSESARRLMGSDVNSFVWVGGREFAYSREAVRYVADACRYRRARLSKKLLANTKRPIHFCANFLEGLDLESRFRHLLLQSGVLLLELPLAFHVHSRKLPIPLASGIKRHIN
jgi:hypothetical protein